jgi:hypothetical protein
MAASGDGCDIEVREKLADPAFDLVADGADVFDCLAGGVVEDPVEVALAGEDGAGVAAAHGDHDVGGADDLVGPGFGELAGDVDAAFTHGGGGGRVETEYSLWSRHVEVDILPTIKRLNIGFVAYSPLGRGFLSGAIQSRGDLEPGDWRLENPRFAEEAIARNSRLADFVAEVAKEIEATTAQVALAWILSRDVSLVAIPGTRRTDRLEENWAAQDVTLRTEHLDRLESQINQGVVGDRF